MSLKPFAVAAVLLLPAGVSAWAQGVAPGTRFEVRLQDLPAPFASPSVSNPPAIVAPPEDAEPRVPEGFRVNVFADGLENARWLTVAPNGDVFLAEPAAGRVTVLRDGNGDGVADEVRTFADGFDLPHGLAVRPGYLYVADVERVWRIPYEAGRLDPAGPKEAVTEPGALGTGRGHFTRNIAFSPDGSRFFVAIGSAHNIAEELPPRASVQEFDADGRHIGSYAEGLRNPVGIAFYPGTSDLYVVVNERDTLGDGLVPDYLTHLEMGGFYGWPYSYLGSNPQPGFADKRPDLVRAAIPPDLLFRAHSAPLGLVFYDGAQFPPQYRGDAFVALHGSWNSSKPQGYMVVRVPFKDRRPAGSYEAFMTGFWAEGEKRASVWGRPVGLAVAADGSLLVADDAAGKIWRVSYAP
jgi:glucose/arabinose dehydrogenase